VTFERDAEGAVTRTIPTTAVEAAAAALGADAVQLGKLIRSAHHRFGAGRLRVDGKLTDRCGACGARMERLGFRCWVDAPHEATDSRTRIADRLGFEPPRDHVRTFYVDTKREAAAWARDEQRTAKAVAAEVTA
jgi:hypothetical protein